jgi:PAS domain S-box-containing protein
LAILELGPGLVIRLWSPGAERLFGFCAAEALGETPQGLGLVSGGDLERALGLWSGLWSGCAPAPCQGPSDGDQGAAPGTRLAGRRKDGAAVFGEWHCAALCDAGGSTEAILAQVLDLSPRLRAEEALKGLFERYELIAAGTCDAVWDWDVSNRRVYFSPRWKELRGLAPEEVGDSEDEWIASVHPEDLPRVLTAVREHFEGRTEVFCEEYRIRLKDGGWKWILDRGMALRDASGQVIRMAGSESDIDERRRTEEAREEGESFYRQTLESIPGMVFTTRPDGWCDYQSRQWVDYTGIPMSEHLGDGWNRLLHPQDAPRAYAAWQAAVDGRAPYDLEYRVRRHDGVYEWFRVVGTPIRDAAGRIVRWFGVAVNIERLKAAELALQEGERRLRWALQAAGGGAWDWDLTLGEAWWSAEMYGLWGIAPGTPMGLDNSLACIDPKDRESVQQAVTEAIAGHLDYRCEFRVSHPALGERWVSSHGRPVYDSAGTAVRLLGISLDITERRRAEEARRESEGRLKGILDSAMDAIVSVDEGQRICLFNPAAEALFGIPAARALGLPLGQLLPERFREAHPGHVVAFAQTGVTARRMGHLTQIAGLRADGREVPVEASISQTVAGGGRIFTAILRDIAERLESEARLKRSQEELRAFVRHAPIAIALYDRGMNYLAASGRWIQDYGQGRTDLTGLNHYALYPDIPDDWRRVHRECLAGATLKNDADLWTRADGTRHWLRWAVLPWTDDRGAIGGIVISAEDITDRILAAEALKESEGRFRRLADTMPQLVWTAEPDGRVDYYNRRVEEYDGIAAQPDSTWTWQPVLHPDDLGTTVRAWECAVATGGIYQCEHRVRMADGTLRWHLSRGLPVRDDSGAIVKWFGTATDIQALKRAQEDLEEADRRKNEFLAILAHELRNPLVPIRNATEILRLKAESDPRLSSAQAMIDRQLGHMVRLIDDLMDVSRITRGRLQLRVERIDLSALLGQTLDAAGPGVDLSGHRLSVSLPPEPILLDADPVRLAQVFLNLLNNACKYTESGGRIRVRAERLGEEALVTVADSGIGIGPEHLGHIFEMFAQVGPSAERSSGGLGIGLSLAKALVELHGGRIEAQSAGIGQGSAFLVHLPIPAAAGPGPQSTGPERGESASAQPGAPPRPIPGLRVLVADDNPDIADSLATLLGIYGCLVETAGDGEEAVAAAERFRPDLILLDIGMPRLDGHAACREIRRRPWGREATLVALTGWGQEEDRRRSREAGFDLHLVKPVGLKELEKVVEGG